MVDTTHTDRHTNCTSHEKKKVPLIFHTECHKGESNSTAGTGWTDRCGKRYGEGPIDVCEEELPVDSK